MGDPTYQARAISAIRSAEPRRVDMFDELLTLWKLDDPPMMTLIERHEIDEVWAVLKAIAHDPDLVAAVSNVAQELLLREEDADVSGSSLPTPNKIHAEHLCAAHEQRTALGFEDHEVRAVSTDEEQRADSAFEALSAALPGGLTQREHVYAAIRSLREADLDELADAAKEALGWL